MWILIYVMISIRSGDVTATGNAVFDSKLSCEVAKTALHVELFNEKVKSVCVPK